MTAKRRDPSVPAWDHDDIDSSSPPEIEDPYFDGDLEAWVLSRHADVLAAFQSPTLSVVGARAGNAPDDVDEVSRLQMRAETQEALSPSKLREWREQWLPAVQALVEKLPIDRPVDLIGEYARPVCFPLAVLATGVGPADAERLEKIARHVSAAAAEPFDPNLRSLAKASEAELQGCFHAGPLPLRDPGFVALSQTLPCLMANAWFALLRHPREWSRLHQQSELMPQAMEELLRYAGLTRVLFRQATAATDLNGFHIRAGERIVLRLFPANRDPERFPDPGRLDITRRVANQLTLGAGPHACVGASLIRMAAIVATQPLLERFAGAELIGPVEWQGGAGFRSPKSLPVRLRAK
ncbi:MAG TPA: cytochrome P450 [Bryobacteraceae bacterium]|nr:cytochrome P450 [Bryobacteraceae bacterium]